jgi:hypothetical protein
MKIHEIPFNNYYTTEEVSSFAKISDLDDKQSLRIQIPLENRRLAYFEVKRIEHPNWAFKSTCVQFTGWEDEVEFFREKALQFVQVHVNELTGNNCERLSLKVKEQNGNITQEHKEIFLRLSRPFMFPFTQLDSFLKQIGRAQGRNLEMEFLLGWRGKDTNRFRYDSEAVLEAFLESAEHNLNTMPEVIPAMHFFMGKMDKGGLPGRALAKIRDTHGPDDPKRARVEAVKAVWGEHWDDYLAWYAKIPHSMHDWDPVPRYFLPLAMHERVEGMDVVLETYKEISYYGGIPLYLIYSIRGCWEFVRGDFQAALASKLEAYRSGVSQEYIAIQLAKIYNKLGMHENVLPLFTISSLDEIYISHEEEDLDAAMTQICIALKALNDAELTSNFEAIVSNDPYYDEIAQAYQKAQAEHFTDLKEQTPVMRALEGCMG